MSLLLLFGQSVGVPPVTGEVDALQAAQTEAASGALTFAGAAGEVQALQTESAAGAQTVAGTASQVQAAQTHAATGALTFTGSTTQTQAVQTEASTGAQTVTGTVTAAQAAQTEAASEAPAFTGTVTALQGAQQEAASGDTAAPSAPRRRRAIRLPLPPRRPAPITGDVASVQPLQRQRARGIVIPPPVIRIPPPAPPVIPAVDGDAWSRTPRQTSRAAGGLSFTGRTAARQAVAAQHATAALTLVGASSSVQAIQTQTARGRWDEPAWMEEAIIAASGLDVVMDPRDAEDLFVLGLPRLRER